MNEQSCPGFWHFFVLSRLRAAPRKVCGVRTDAMIILVSTLVHPAKAASSRCPVAALLLVVVQLQYRDSMYRY